jgi:signal peptide peptidase SppA
MNLLSMFSGGTSTQLLTDTVNAAAADAAVHSIILSIDSPGGEVDGVQVAAQAIAAAAQQKPVLAWLDGCCCSGAYWLASQASGQYIADGTTIVGSIGVVMTHTDRSKANEQAGKKVTEVTAGKYKRIASSHSALTQEGRDTIQGQVDQVYSVFVDNVASGLGVSTDTVLSDMADGRIFIGQQAIDAGLAQGVASLNDLVRKLSAANQPQPQNPAAHAGSTTNLRTEGNTMFKTFATEAEYNAAIAAEFERGKTNPGSTKINTVAESHAHIDESEKLAFRIRERVAEAKRDGRNISVSQAAAELEIMDSLAK